MTLQLVFLSLIFHHVFCCLSPEPQTKSELCTRLQSIPQNSFPVGNGFNMRDLEEFCDSNSVGDGRNGLCEHIHELTPQLPTFLAGNLTEFCNQDPKVLRRRFSGRPGGVEIFQPNIIMDR